VLADVRLIAERHGFEPEKVSGVTVQSEETVTRDFQGNWFLHPPLNARTCRWSRGTRALSVDSGQHRLGAARCTMPSAAYVPYADPEPLS
jgi:hypothetical protein